MISKIKLELKNGHLYNKKYELNEIISGDSIFCATGITSGDLVAGDKFKTMILFQRH